MKKISGCTMLLEDRDANPCLRFQSHAVSLPINPPWLLFLWHVQIRLLPVCLPNYSLHIFLFFLGPSIQHTLTVSWLMFVKDDMEKSFVFHGKTSLCCISSHLWTYSSCKHHRLGYWWTLVWGGALTLYRHVPTAHNVSLFLMLTQ